jgi:hypothetical protein
LCRFLHHFRIAPLNDRFTIAVEVDRLREPSSRCHSKTFFVHAPFESAQRSARRSIGIRANSFLLLPHLPALQI